MMELIEGYWHEVGVRARIENVTRSLQWDKTLANEHDATAWQGDAGLSMLVSPHDYMANSQYHAVSWRDWYNSRGADGEEPLEPARRQRELYDQIQASADPDEQDQLMRELLRISKEQFWVIGTVRETEKYTIVADKVANVPERIYQGWDYPSPGPTRPEQYFLRA